MPLNALLDWPARPPHGGNLHTAIARFGGTPDDWLDLSAALNPQPYPTPTLDPTLWQHLPPPCPALLDAARAYYHAPHLLAVAGSQAAIHTLPRLRRPGRVALVSPSYAEHRWGWQAAGHQLSACSPDAHALLAAAAQHDVLVVCQPNNPTGHSYPPELLIHCARQLAAHGGWLVVDEAFIDPTPELSVAADGTHWPGLVVLRSVGKFFGLAGLRLGFVLGHPQLLAALDCALGPWTVSAAAQQIGRLALADPHWPAQARQHLHYASAQLAALLTGHGLAESGTALFRSSWPDAGAIPAAQLHQRLAEQRIWTRLLEGDRPGVRFGLPADAVGWARLARALSASVR
ncbi:MAG: hypothetical protein RI925_1975 [Pseudomonadota bacterium]|jgi:cobalamin biosynthetic protein CobC